MKDGAYTVKTSYMWASDQFKFDLVYIEEVMTTLLFVYHRPINQEKTNKKRKSSTERVAFQNLKNKYFGPTELIYNPTDQLVAVWNFPAHYNKQAVIRKNKKR